MPSSLPQFLPSNKLAPADYFEPELPYKLSPGSKVRPGEETEKVFKQALRDRDVQYVFFVNQIITEKSERMLDNLNTSNYDASTWVKTRYQKGQEGQLAPGRIIGPRFRTQIASSKTLGLFVALLPHVLTCIIEIRGPRIEIFRKSTMLATDEQYTRTLQNTVNTSRVRRKLFRSNNGQRDVSSLK
ncbi:uncharacterized protein EAF01_003529 [Botrytis porri]|uniref:Uncharacterized protein n=1 Tax=Botrytis porri TaxID=87229 RepID=A0A4Z1KPI1_9HELO|nr:uncharacterized protein EAF01_003529 [Botrytis porri]KAF7909811.1 hypothetical protein EAF01_003529 [Botrytis porri]TGO85624.1 hypothetical protein BPOR_0378g00010 [Botrytis porri]